MIDALRQDLLGMLAADEERRAELPAEGALFEAYQPRMQYDWDEAGALSPLPIEDADGVDARRRGVGLGPLVENTKRMRATMPRESAPADPAAQRREQERWRRDVGSP